MRKGFTLAEAIVGGGLAFLVLAVGVMVFVPALRVWNRGQARSEVQQAALVGGNWLRRDIEHAAPETIYWEGGGLRLVVQGRPLEHDSSGAALWHEHVFYWLGDKGELHRQARELKPPPSEPPQLPVPARDPEARVIARNIYAFDCGVNEERVRYHLEASTRDHRYVLDGMATTILKAP